MSGRDVLVELGTEELPPKALPELERAFREGVAKGLEGLGFAPLVVDSFAAPRRLAVLVRGLPARQPDQDIARRGPPVSAAFDRTGAPTRAATAFAESCGVPIEALVRVVEAKGEFLSFRGRRAGAPTEALLPDIVRAALEALPIPRRMRWGAGEAEFVRPVHWLVMLFGSDVVEARILDTAAGRATRGHRFMAPAPLPLAAPADYEGTLLERGKVVARFAARRARVREQVIAEAARLGGRPVMDDALLDEVTALVEWPVALVAHFEERFLELPREVLIATLQAHQRYFPVEGEAGRLTSAFIAVSNLESRDPARVREGNERVVRPRLADAAFFWSQDRAAPLASRREALDRVTFQAKLGSLGDKSHRISTLAQQIAGLCGFNVSLAVRCAELAKCDLLTSVVGEFPELQGVMGAYYAAADGEPREVAHGIREHYLPRGAGDALPTTEAGIAVALADRLDTLAGIFAISEKPTGTKDPFGLRRAAIGIVRILTERGLDLDLRALVDAAVAAQPVKRSAVAGEVLAYITERLRAYYLDGLAPAHPAGVVTTEQIEAVLAAAPRSLVDFGARLAALSCFLARPEAESLAAAHKRIANILRKAGAEPPSAVDESALREPAERALHAALVQGREEVGRAVAAREYDRALDRLATLRPEVDAFFDAVMVMDPDPVLRANRLALLVALRGEFAAIADLSCLPGR